MVFRPDRRQVLRLKAVRHGLMLVAMVVLGTAILVIYRYRPVIAVESDARPGLADSEPARAEREREAEVSGRAGAEGQERKGRNGRVRTEAWADFNGSEPGPNVQLRPEQKARRLALEARSRVGVLQALHRQVVELFPAAPFDQAAHESLLGAQALLDSIGLGLIELRRASEQLEQVSFELGAAHRYDVGLVRDALSPTQEEIEAQYRDLVQAVDNLAQAVAAGDQTAADIKAGVATSYRLQSERRVRSVGRRAASLQAAVQRLLDRRE